MWPLQPLLSGRLLFGIFLLRYPPVPDIPDGKYHWYKLGRLTIGPRSVLYAHHTWGLNADLRNIFTPNDGLAGTDKDPNIYECWVSLRFDGPAYTGKKAGKSVNKKSGVWMDKVLLIPYEK